VVAGAVVTDTVSTGAVSTDTVSTGVVLTAPGRCEKVPLSAGPPDPVDDLRGRR